MENKDFLKDYEVLIKKYKMDFASYPVWVPNDQGQWVTVIQTQTVDTSKQPIKSDFLK